MASLGVVAPSAACGAHRSLSSSRVTSGRSLKLASGFLAPAPGSYRHAWPVPLGNLKHAQTRSAARKGLETPARDVEHHAQSEPQPLAWSKQWWCIGVADDFDKDKPHAIDLLGGKFVLWAGADGQWHVQKDLCPHRLAPLSEGKIVDNSIQCSYHGWRFDGDGKPVFIPQTPADQTTAVYANPRACVASLPVRMVHGMLWVWPDDSEARFIESSMVPVAQELPPEDSDSLKWIEFLPLYMREFPYSYETLFDNALDPSHVPWSHHGVIGDREKASPLAMKTVRSVSREGIAVQYPAPADQASAAAQAAGASNDVTLHFKAPHTLLYDVKRQDGTVSKLLAYVTPTAPGRCRVTSASFDTKRSFQNFFTSGFMPEWASHLIFMEAGDGDIVLLKAQEQLLPNLEGGWRSFFLPNSADKMVSLWRRWLEKFTTKEANPYMLTPPGTPPSSVEQLSKGELLDRQSQHTKHCKSCSGAMRNFEKLKWAATLGVVIAAQLAFLAVVGLWNGPAPLAGALSAAGGLQLGPVLLPARAVVALVCAAVGAVFASLASTFGNLQQSFIFKDYVHAHI